MIDHSKRDDFFTRAARRKKGIPADFVWCEIRAIAGDGILLRGCSAPMEYYKTGKKASRAKWPPKASLTTVCLTQDEVDMEKVRYELETGNCHNCLGTKQTVKSVGVDGTTYRTCFRCKGTGVQP